MRAGRESEPRVVGSCPIAQARRRRDAARPWSPLGVRVQAFPIRLIGQGAGVTEKCEVILLLRGWEPPVGGDVPALPLGPNQPFESAVDHFRGRRRPYQRACVVRLTPVESDRDLIFRHTYHTTYRKYRIGGGAHWFRASCARGAESCTSKGAL